MIPTPLYTNAKICLLSPPNSEIKASPYEPYTGGKPSPSPDYLQEIKSVGKWNDEKQKYEVDGKPYYHIKFKKVGEDEYTIGYSSFKLDYVVKWLNDYFEFYGEAKVSCDDNGWIPVQGRLPEDNHKGIYDMQLVTLEDGEVCMGVYNNREKEWWTRKQEGERWYTNKHNVIAWQPLPEPYKEEKKC